MNLPESVLTALTTGLLALPAVILAHRAGMKKQADETDALFDTRMLSALEQRDKTITALQERLSAINDRQAEVYRELGAANAHIQLLQVNQVERDKRERDYISQIAALTETVRHLDNCDGGSPCPMAALRRNRQTQQRSTQ